MIGCIFFFFSKEMLWKLSKEVNEANCENDMFNDEDQSKISLSGTKRYHLNVYLVIFANQGDFYKNANDPLREMPSIAYPSSILPPSLSPFSLLLPFQEVLFSVLGSSNTITPTVFHILSLLPTYDQLYQQILCAEDLSDEGKNSYLKWKDIFPCDRLYNLNYSLRIVEVLIEKTENETIDVDTVDATVYNPSSPEAGWRSRFIRKGGLMHLVELLFTVDFEGLSPSRSLTPPPVSFNKFEVFTDREESTLSVDSTSTITIRISVFSLLIKIIQELVFVDSNFKEKCLYHGLPQSNLVYDFLVKQVMELYNPQVSQEFIVDFTKSLFWRLLYFVVFFSVEPKYSPFSLVLSVDRKGNPFIWEATFKSGIGETITKNSVGLIRSLLEISKKGVLTQNDYDTVARKPTSYVKPPGSVSPSPMEKPVVDLTHPYCKTITESIIKIINHLVLCNQHTVFNILFTSHFGNCVKILLFRSLTHELRMQYANFLLECCNTPIFLQFSNQDYLLKYDTLPLFTVRDLLLDFFDDVDEFPCFVVEPYFTVLRRLLLKTIPDQKSSTTSKIVTHFERHILYIEHVCSVFTLVVLNRPTLESYHRMNNPDIVLCGLLELLRSLVEMGSESVKALLGQEYNLHKSRGFDLVRHIFHHMLFDMTDEDGSNDGGEEHPNDSDDEYTKVWSSSLSASSLAIIVTPTTKIQKRPINPQEQPPTLYPQCKIEETRGKAYGLLHALCKGCPENLLKTFILISMLQFREHWREVSGFERSLSSDFRNAMSGFFFFFEYFLILFFSRLLWVT
jgi:hypothetical protein